MHQIFAIPRESLAVAILGKAVVVDYRCKDYNAPPFYQNQKISLKSIDDIFQMRYWISAIGGTKPGALFVATGRSRVGPTIPQAQRSGQREPEK
jgi:hypothetical protein